MNIDFHTIGEISIAFIDDKNKIQTIDTSLNYYFAGKLNQLLFLSRDYSITDNIITFQVDTYTDTFLTEITKRNTEIKIELGTNTNGVQTVLLRDYAFAQPRVYIEGLNPSEVDLGDYYTKEEVDSLLSDTKTETENLLAEKADKTEIPTKLSQLENNTGYITSADIPNSVLSINGLLPDEDGYLPLTAADVAAEKQMELFDLAQWDIGSGSGDICEGPGWIVHLKGGTYYYCDYVLYMGLYVNTVDITTSEIILDFMFNGISVSFPSNIVWLEEPTFLQGYRYIISIVNGIGVVKGISLEGTI